ncbi:helix-turn-helix domain-containing protein [Brevibacillus laterosporus]|uniref:Helix-turn-helix transcriptional regulator n=1 Tax=Brevibacillus halotolerans TaxID=1507437 RepID=A0ABT4I310_9BACL|nr:MULTISPECIES: helix-turn-helix transcriptional regulator [Brevibacillus]MCR8987700.1 helix-turn-helix domain-containing protein [Brevibacillus laterosporus]MCZ0833439.1 helix-turn-helix transcriptional regulator [Brevibacillus halotolerans]
MGLSALLYTTLGEYIRNKRLEMGISLSELSRRTGLSKGVLSKIEVGDTKHPLLRTIKTIGEVIYMPKDEIISIYLRDEKNPDILQELLEEAIAINNLEIVKNIALQFLGSPAEDSYTLIEQLFTITNKVKDIPSKCKLYSTMIEYARERGMQDYLARGLLELYLIERDDFCKLESTYASAKYLLHYVNFLSEEQRIIAYYKLGVHAFNLRYYEEAIELCKKVVVEDHTDSEIKRYALVAIYNSYYHLNDFRNARYYLDMYSKLKPKDTKDQPGPFSSALAKSFQDIENHSNDEIVVFSALLAGKEGKVNEAIETLLECLHHVEEYHYIDVVNGLYELLLLKGNIGELDKLEYTENVIKNITVFTPYKGSGVARYYKLKAEFYERKLMYSKACSYYVKSMNSSRQIGAHEKEYEALIKIMDICINHFDKEQIGETLGTVIGACVSAQAKIIKEVGLR